MALSSAEKQQRWRAAHPAEQLARSRAAATKSRETLEGRLSSNANMRAWRRKNPVRARQISRRGTRKAKGVEPFTVEQEAALYLQQNNSCAICGAVVPLALDHDHNTGRVRGLLCRACNTLLGRTLERVEWAEWCIRATHYLRRIA